VSFRLACVMGADTVCGGPARRSNGGTIAGLSTWELPEF